MTGDGQAARQSLRRARCRSRQSIVSQRRDDTNLLESGRYRASEPGTAAARRHATAVVVSDLSGRARTQLRRRVPARSASPSES